MSKDAKQARKAPEPIPVPDIYSDSSQDEKGANAVPVAPATPAYHALEGFDPCDTASLQKKWSCAGYRPK